MTEARPETELSDAAARLARQARLAEPHAAPLVPFVEGLRKRHPDRVVPWFDPADGGAHARVLYLLEKPSRGSVMTEEGPVYVGLDNPTSGSRRMKALMAEAGVPREAMLIWNAVPWWNGTAKVTGEEVRAGADALDRLLALMPRLRAVVLVGRKAERAWALSGGAAVPVFVSAHPSANVRAAFPERWMAIPSVWAEAWRAVSASAEGQCAASAAPPALPKT